MSWTMHLEFERCCCFIPLRLGAFFIALYFFVVYLVELVLSLCGIDAVSMYAGQVSRIWHAMDLILTISICVGGLMGVAGSTICASRRAALVFGVVVWINCALSIAKYVVSLALIASFQDSIVRSCLRSGIVGLGNAQAYNHVFPTSSSFYTPVRYQDTLNANGLSLDNCQQGVRSMLIGYGIFAFVIQLVQLYFALVVSTYTSRLRIGARHHRLHDQQIKEFEESRFHMTTVY